MPGADRAFKQQAQQPGPKLIADFEALKNEADSDAAVEFLAKNRATVTSSMDSEQAFELLRKMPRQTQDPGLADTLQGALQTVYDRSMRAEPGTDMVAAFDKRGAPTGVAFLEKNLNAIDPEQTADIVAKLREIDFPYTDKADEKRKQDAFRKRIDVLVQNIEAIIPPEAHREASGAERPVLSEVQIKQLEEAKMRVATLSEAFDSYRGSLTEGTKAKVEKWQRELYQLRETLGEEEGAEVDTLYEQMTDYVRSVNEASKARQVIGQGRSSEGVRRTADSPKGRLPLPSQGKPQGAWGKFKSFLGVK